MLTVDGIPAHPLVVHAVVVLLPLAAVGTLLVVARPLWRRQLGVWVLLLALAGTAAVPVAQQTGAQLAESFGGGGPLVMEHAMRAEHPPAARTGVRRPARRDGDRRPAGGRL